jgi:hypothetical protein
MVVVFGVVVVVVVLSGVGERLWFDGVVVVVVMVPSGWGGVRA